LPDFQEFGDEAGGIKKAPGMRGTPGVVGGGGGLKKFIVCHCVLQNSLHLLLVPYP